jgi:3-oxoacyl-(acyl-carrier-protein) synthase
MSKKVLITGMGMISSIGKNVEETYESLIKEKSGTGKATILNTIHQDTFPLSEIKLTDDQLLTLAGLQNERIYTRTTCLGLIAAREAVENAGLGSLTRLKTGVISGTTVGGMGKTEVHYKDYLKPENIDINSQYVDTHDCGDSTQTIADLLGYNDFVTTISTACSSSANAIMLGARLIKSGMLDRVIVGGVDSLTKFTINGFNTLMILDKELCRSFDADRKGLNLGEAAGYIVIESEEAAKEGNRPILGEVKGYANSNDAYHQTASSPEGNGAFMAMSKALQVAGLSPKDIDYVNVHGTGTPNNDLSEGNAMARLFEGVFPRFSSTKAYTGHTLGAAGGIEAIISLLSIKYQTIFPNLNYRTPMPELSPRPVTSLITDANLKVVLSNSFGFGGNNTSLLFSAY